MRTRFDLSGFWHGKLDLDAPLEVAAPLQVRRHFYVPMPWNKQVEDLRWPSAKQELSGVVRSLQNQNFRDVHRKFNEGRITYFRMVSIPEALVESAGSAGSMGRRAYLVFEGSNYRTTAVVNGKRVGTHLGGHLRFEFDVNTALQPGVNKFQIIVDNHRQKDACPQEQFNWQNYGGIYRPVYLEWRPGLHLTRYAVHPGHDQEGWFADITADMSEPAAGMVWAEITSGKETNKVQLTGLAESRHGRVYFKNPVVWQPGLGGVSQFHLVFDVGGETIDEVVGTFGFRTLECRGESILINGQPVRLAGVNLHEQHPCFGNSVPGWQSMRDIKLMKQAGINAIRAAHYPHCQEFYDACDREGMLVLAELPCWQFDSRQMNDVKTRDLCVDMAKQMAAQLRHHPCIIGWVMQSDSKTFERGAKEFFTAVQQEFKKADVSRLLVSAENPYPPQAQMAAARAQGKPAGDLPPTAALADVLGINCPAGWQVDKAEQLPVLLEHYHSQAPAKPIFLTDFGAEASPGIRSLEMHPWSEDYQAELLCRHIRAVMAMPWVAGFFIGYFADFELSSVGVRGMASRGLVDEYRRPKLAFNEVRNLLASLRPEQIVGPTTEVVEEEVLEVEPEVKGIKRE